MRKPRYYEVMLVLACASFYIGSNIEGLDGLTGVGFALLLFAVFKYFEFLSERWVHIKYY